MAAEGFGDPAVQQTLPSVPITLPPYPEMILAAIQAINDPNGSNKTQISKHIESTYGELPPAHATLLTHHLNKLKQSNQLVLLKNNYLIPDPTSPPRRGRGRPPKPKPEVQLPVGPPRPRGRPPKVRDPSDPLPVVAKTVGSTGRGRGRPPKMAKVGGGGDTSESGGGVMGGVKRGRGRPPKVKNTVALVGS